MTNPKAPDGWCAWNPLTGFALNCACEKEAHAWDSFFAVYDEYIDEEGNTDCDTAIRDGWTIKPVYLISPEEKDRIVPQELLEWVEEMRQVLINDDILNAFEATMVRKLRRIWPERVK